MRKTTDAIKTINLTKFFTSKGNPIPAVDGVNIEISQGEIFGLMGPNGAGKTTLLKILTTLLLPSSGEAYVSGYSIREEDKVKGSIGVISSEERSFYWRLTGRENLRFFATLHNLNPSEIKRRIESITGTLGLKDFLDRRFDSYSTGMKQKLSIARSLICNPKILFTDEPTKGIDPVASSQIRELLRGLSLTGITIFIITHSTEEAKEICKRVAIMDKGRIKAEARPDKTELKDFLIEHIGGHLE
jgi:ABC-2 type transport system ATP-binding protein